MADSKEMRIISRPIAVWLMKSFVTPRRDDVHAKKFGLFNM